MPRVVNRVEFLQALNLVSPGRTTREIQEQTSCFAFIDGEVRTYNEEISCRVRSGLDKDLEGAVPSEPLLKLIDKIPEDELEIFVDKGELVILGMNQGKKGINREAAIRIETKINMPLEHVEEPGKWYRLPESFNDAVAKVHVCCSKDQTKFPLPCVHLTPDWMEACDNVQMIRYHIEIPLDKNALIRKETIKHLVELGVTEMSETQNWLHFRQKDFIISLHRYIEPFRDIGPHLKVKGVETTLPKGLAEAVNIAEIFSKENTDANAVEVSLKPGVLLLTGRGITGYYKERRDLEYDGEKLRFLIAPSLLASLVKESHCEVSADRLKVNGGSFVYVTCLGIPE